MYVAHSENGRYMKAMVFGAMDGIMTTFAVVAGVAGANLKTSVVLILGIANLIANGVCVKLVVAVCVCRCA